jgi:hypothetical protein
MLKQESKCLLVKSPHRLEVLRQLLVVVRPAVQVELGGRVATNISWHWWLLTILFSVNLVP